MNPLEAAQVFGAIVFLGSPSSFSIGCDYAEWKPPGNGKAPKVDEGDTDGCTTATASGAVAASAPSGEAPAEQSVWVVSSLLPGTHFAYWKNPEGIQHGTFVHLAPSEVAVFRWLAKEDFFVRVTDEVEVARFQQGWKNLSLLTRAVEYPEQFRKPWQDVTFAVTALLVKMIQGSSLGKGIGEYGTSDATSAYFDERLQQLEDLYQWSDIPRRRMPPGQASGAASTAGGAQLSQFGLDSSPRLEELLKDYRERVSNSDGMGHSWSSFDKNELEAVRSSLKLNDGAECLLVGELQLSNLGFLLNHSFEAMQQWKALLILLSNAACLADEEKYYPLGRAFLRAFYGQIDQCPEDFLTVDFTKSNFIIHSLMNSFELFEDCPDVRIKKLLGLLRESVERKFKMTWTEIYTLQEEGPQVVDIIDDRMAD